MLYYAPEPIISAVLIVAITEIARCSTGLAALLARLRRMGVAL